MLSSVNPEKGIVRVKGYFATSPRATPQKLSNRGEWEPWGKVCHTAGVASLLIS